MISSSSFVECELEDSQNCRLFLETVIGLKSHAYCKYHECDREEHFGCEKICNSHDICELLVLLFFSLLYNILLKQNSVKNNDIRSISSTTIKILKSTVRL
ncbi:unnamed protein product [Orchesella dallaii]|uniref:Uncharacterized protein n=1 Tax=Orchesella dallaii TaxID=48710 RepID=A0ABP1PTY0_9HEXA